MENNTSELQIYFLELNSINLFTHIKIDLFDNDWVLIKKKDIYYQKINNDIFKYKDIIVTKLKLKNKDSSIQEFNFNLYKRKNKYVCFLSSLLVLIEIYFFQDFQNLIVEDKDIIQYSNDTKYRKRFVLINCPPTIKINSKITYSFPYSSDSEMNSFQICYFDIEKKIYSSKMIKEEINENIFIKEIIDKSKDLNNFYDDFQILIEKQNISLKDIDTIIDKYEYFINLQYLSFIKNQDLLLQQYSKTNINDYFYLNIWIVLYLKLVPIHLIKDWINNYTNFYNKIKRENIVNYQKIELLYTYSKIITKKDYKNNIKDTIFNYFLIDNLEDESLYKKVISFISKFIENLTEDSFLFYPLLLLNSGINDFKERSQTYGFNLLSVDMIKNHLKQELPKIMYYYNYDDDALAFSDSCSTIIFINEKKILNGYKKNPRKKDNSLEGKNYSVKLLSSIMYEMMKFQEKFVHINLLMIKKN